MLKRFFIKFLHIGSSERWSYASTIGIVVFLFFRMDLVKGQTIIYGNIIAVNISWA